MAKWTLHPALVKLREQINDRWPDRLKIHDGAIGDTAHASRKSDHNPLNGVVHAIDITHDPMHGFDASVFAERLRLSRDKRISYVIWNKRMFSSYRAKDGTPAWVWRAYTGSNPHDKHVHVSVNSAEPPWTIE